MSEQDNRLSERLLQNWEFRRQMATYYFDSLLHLDPNDDNAHEKWRELNEKLALSQMGLRHAGDQLQSYEHEQGIKKKSLTACSN